MKLTVVLGVAIIEFPNRAALMNAVWRPASGALSVPYVAFREAAGPLARIVYMNPDAVRSQLPFQPNPSEKRILTLLSKEPHIHAVIGFVSEDKDTALNLVRTTLRQVVVSSYRQSKLYSPRSIEIAENGLMSAFLSFSLSAVKLAFLIRRKVKEAAGGLE